jgi:hypothetical protein
MEICGSLKRTEALGVTTSRPLKKPVRHGLEGVLGHAAWQRLPEAVRARFGDPAVAVDYIGEFEIVRASPLGRFIAWLAKLIGTPVVPRTGFNVPTVVRVGPSERGVVWDRQYQWPNSSPCSVRSTKVIGPDGVLIEELPARLCMPLDVFEHGGVLHFVSRGYYFDLCIRRNGRHIKVGLPAWLSPGTTHVEHVDGAGGWFRFTMTVTHPVFGELFYQTGCFRAAGG